MDDFFKYRYRTDIEFSVKPNTHLSIIGNSSDMFLDTLLNKNEKCNIFIGEEELNEESKYSLLKKISFTLHKHLDIFLAETVEDEIAYDLESLAFSKDDMRALITGLAKRFKIEELLKRDPNSLGSSDKVKMKILSSFIIKPKILVLDNIMCELDYSDKILVYDLLKEYTKNGGILINITNDIEDCLYSDRIIILHDNKLVCDGKMISVLNEEKLLKRLGLGIPFIIELNKYFMDYGIINKYYMTNEKLVGALWK